MKTKLLLAALTAVALWSCEKNDGDNNESEKTSLLTQQSWKLQGIGLDIDANGSVDLDLTGQIPACVTDNTVSFSANGNGMANEGATKCNASDPQTASFTWSFANQETALNINGNAVAGVQNGGQFRINTLSGTQLILAKDTTHMGLQGAVVATFIH